jgi:3-dehydroquinate synthetase
MTLPAEEIISGMAEIIKHGLLADTDLLEKVENGDWHLKSDFLHSAHSEIQSLVAQSIQVKISYVQKDPFDEGVRKQLNMGHTFAHAIEKVSNNSIRHGEAVAMGLAAAADLSLRLGYCSKQFRERIDAVLSRVGLPNRLPNELSPPLILDAMRQDKKRLGQAIRLVLPVEAGKVIVPDNITKQNILQTLETLSKNNHI